MSGIHPSANLLNVSGHSNGSLQLPLAKSTRRSGKRSNESELVPTGAGGNPYGSQALSTSTSHSSTPLQTSGVTTRGAKRGRTSDSSNATKLSYLLQHQQELGTVLTYSSVMNHILQLGDQGNHSAAYKYFVEHLELFKDSPDLNSLFNNLLQKSREHWCRSSPQLAHQAGLNIKPQPQYALVSGHLIELNSSISPSSTSHADLTLSHHSLHHPNQQNISSSSISIKATTHTTNSIQSNSTSTLSPSNATATKNLDHSTLSNSHKNKNVNNHCSMNNNPGNPLSSLSSFNSPPSNSNLQEHDIDNDEDEDEDGDEYSSVSNAQSVSPDSSSTVSIASSLRNSSSKRSTRKNQAINVSSRRMRQTRQRIACSDSVIPQQSQTVIGTLADSGFHSAPSSSSTMSTTPTKLTSSNIIQISSGGPSSPSQNSTESPSSITPDPSSPSSSVTLNSISKESSDYNNCIHQDMVPLSSNPTATVTCQKVSARSFGSSSTHLASSSSSSHEHTASMPIGSNKSVAEAPACVESVNSNQTSGQISVESSSSSSDLNMTSSNENQDLTSSSQSNPNHSSNALLDTSMDVDLSFTGIPLYSQDLFTTWTSAIEHNS